MKRNKRALAWLPTLIAQIGTQERLAAKLGVKQSCISHWLKYGVTAERAMDIYQKTGFPLEQMRPDLWR